LTKKKIFALDDEKHIRELLSYNLQNEGFDVNTFASANDLLIALQTDTPDLILLDIMLVDSNGIDVCKKIRNSHLPKNLPIIFLTAKNEELDKILGLEMGADDYITKPFSIRELVTRVKVQLRRANSFSYSENKISCRDIILYLDKREAYKDEQLIEFTYKEFELLRLLMEQRGKVLTREYIISRIWGYDYIGETRTIDVHIRQLRKRIGDENENYIETVRGIGYKFKE